MLKKIGILAGLFLFIIACGTRADESDNEQYVGVWKWVSTDGGIANVHETPDNTKIDRILTINDNYTYSIKENNEIVKEGSYTLGRDVTNTDHSERMFLKLSNYSNFIVSQITASDLYLANDSSDAFTYHYSK